MKYEIPEGWTSEQLGTDTLVISTSPPMSGSVTVDFARRGFRSGCYTTTGRFVTDTLYQGRGWRQRLVADAVKYLARTSAS